MEPVRNNRVRQICGLRRLDPPRRVSPATEQFSLRQARNTLIVRPVHHSQDLAGLRNYLSDAWNLDSGFNFDSRASSFIQDDGTIRFIFDELPRLIFVLEQSPWCYKGWFVLVDRWCNVAYPSFLSRILLWVTVRNIPTRFRNIAMLTEIGNEIGVASVSRLRESNPPRASEDQVRVQISLSAHLEFVMPWIFPPDSQPVDLQLIYEGLQNFCSYCGSILHLYDSCTFPTRSSCLGQSSSPPDRPSPSTNSPVISLPVSQNQQVVFSSSTLCPLPTPQDASQEPTPTVSPNLQRINILPTTITNFRSQRQQSESFSWDPFLVFPRQNSATVDAIRGVRLPPRPPIPPLPENLGQLETPTLVTSRGTTTLLTEPNHSPTHTASPVDHELDLLDASVIPAAAPPSPVRETGGGISPSHGDRSTPNSQNTASTSLTNPPIPVLKVSDEDRQPLSKKEVSQDSQAKADDERGPSCRKSLYRRVAMKSRYAVRKNP